MSLDEPDWVEKFNDRGRTEFAFEEILTEWRRWHWTPVVVDGHDKKKPAAAIDGIIALANLGVMPPR